MSRKTVTKRDAERLAAALRKQYGIDPSDPYGPKVEKDWDWLGMGHPAPWSIVWEGAYDWPQRFGEDGGIDEELTAEARDFDPNAIVRTKGIHIPPHIFAEPITGFAIGLYPNN